MVTDKKLIVGLTFFAAVVAAGVYFLFFGARPSSGPAAVPQSAHFYKDPSVSIAKVRLKMFYVVPKNKADQAYPAWREALQPVLDKMVRFHSLELRGASLLSYDIYPKPVVLSQNNDFYDTTSTENGNPGALEAVANEVNSRVFRRGGDLYGANFSLVASDELLVTGFVYEGVGASGGVGLGASGAWHSFLLSRAFLTSDEYAPYSSTLFYHEFGHAALGFPDMYDLTTNQPYADDIMGGGRHEPIETTYIGRNLLQELGIIPD